MKPHLLELLQSTQIVEHQVHCAGFHENEAEQAIPLYDLRLLLDFVFHYSTCLSSKTVDLGGIVDLDEPVIVDLLELFALLDVPPKLLALKSRACLGEPEHTLL